MTLIPINLDFNFVRSFLTNFSLFPFLIFYVLGFSETFLLHNAFYWPIKGLYIFSWGYA